MALRMDGPNIKPHEGKFRWIPGEKYRCIKSASPAYKVGDVVECYLNGDSMRCIRGRDNLEDLCSMLVSSFKKEEGTSGFLKETQTEEYSDDNNSIN